MSSATLAWTISSPVWRASSKPQKATRIQASSSLVTGQAGVHDERARTALGGGVRTRAAYPSPGSIGTVSGRVNRRSRKAFGVRRGAAYPLSVNGRKRVPSHGGGTVPGGGVSVVEPPSVVEPVET